MHNVRPATNRHVARDVQQESDYFTYDTGIKSAMARISYTTFEFSQPESTRGKQTWLSSHQSCLSIQNKTDVVSTASRPMPFYSLHTFQLRLQQKNHGIITHSYMRIT